MNNKNPGTDIGVQPEDQKAKQPTTRETFYLYQIFRLKGRDPDSMSPQNSTEFLSLPLYIPLSTQPYHSCLHLPSAEIKGMGSQVLGSPLCELCFSFRQIQSCVAQGGLELTEIPLPLSPESWD